MNANDIALFRFVNRSVHPRDEMFATAKISMPAPGAAFHYYFYTGGLVAQRTHDILLEMGKVPARSSLLDFACGYGRITRYFSLMFKEVVCSDLEPEMIAFVRDMFAVDGFLSNADLRALRLPERSFDVVFSFSLFTHLNPEIWASWFWKLSECVSKENGIFIFSTRSPEFARRKGEDFKEGDQVKFAHCNETRGRLDASVYGQTTVTREFVESVIAQRHGTLRYFRYFPAGKFDLYQDMHVLVSCGGTP